MLRAYCAAVLGSVARILVNAVKEARSSGGFLAIDDWVLWLHAKYVSVISAVILLYLGITGLVLTYGKPHELQAYFFAGYSIDSILDVFLRRFEGLAGAKLSAVTAAVQKGG